MHPLIADGRPFVAGRDGSADLSRQEFRAARESGAVRQLLRSVWVDSAVPDTRELRARALHLVMPPCGVLYGTTAMWLRGVDGFQPEQRSVLLPRCVVPHGTTRRTGRGVHTVEGYLPATDVMEEDGLRLTVDERTTADVLRTLRRPFAFSAAEAMARAGLVDRATLRRRIDGLRGFPGVVQARGLVGLIDPQVQSPGESWTKLRLIDAGLPLPRPQIPIMGVRGTVRAWLDLGYEQPKVAVEYDGREVHTEDVDTMHDAARREWVRQTFGWRIAVATKESVFSREPSFELEVAGWLGLEPVLPRSW